MIFLEIILVVVLAIDVSSLIQISTKNKRERSHSDSQDVVSAFLRSDIRKIETMLDNLPECNNRRVDVYYKSGYNTGCKRTKRAFEGLLNIFKKLNNKYDEDMESSVAKTNGKLQKKYQIVTRPTDPPEAAEVTEPSTADPGPGIIQYILCFVKSTKYFSLCVHKAKRDENRQARYQYKFNTMTLPPEVDEAMAETGEAGIDPATLNCIHKAYEVFSVCTVGKTKNEGSEDDNDPTFRGSNEQEDN